MGLFCKHEFEFDDKFRVVHYFFIYDVSSSYFYTFKCSKCGKTKKLPVTSNEYHKRDTWFLNKLTQ